jgi:hypothetical protein
LLRPPPPGQRSEGIPFGKSRVGAAMRLSGKTAFISGAGGGISAAYVIRDDL